MDNLPCGDEVEEFVSTTRRRNLEGETVKFYALAAAWDRNQLQVGNHINIGDEAFHPNTWSVEAAVAHAYSAIGATACHHSPTLSVRRAHGNK